jgi:drug/metabolite transporter (DMT)-like permease
MALLNARVRAARPTVRAADLVSAGRGLRFGRADALMMLTMLIWGINITSVKVVVGALPPLGFGLVRYALASGVLFAILKWREGSLRVRRADLGWMIPAGAIGIGCNQIAFLLGVRMMSASLAAIILATTPLITACLAAGVAHERLRPRALMALLISFCGVVVVIVGQGGRMSASWAGGLLILAAGVTLALGAIWAKWPLRTCSPLRVTAWMAFVGGLALLPLGLPALATTAPSSITPLIAAAIAFTVLGSTVLGNMAWNYAVQQLGATRTAAYTYLQPVVAVAIAAVLLGERLAPVQFLGGAVVLLGLLLYAAPRATRPGADAPQEAASERTASPLMVPRLPRALLSAIIGAVKPNVRSGSNRSLPVGVSHMANEEHVVVLKQGTAVWRRWRAENDGSHPDLTGASLAGVRLNRADLQGVDFRGASLTFACFKSADLREANFGGAALEAVDFGGANLEGASLINANLQGANLRGANLRNAHLEGANLANANLADADLTGVDLTDVDLRASKLT